MKKIILAILFFVPVVLSADNGTPAIILDKAIAALKADFPVRMTFTYTVYDADGLEESTENGLLCVSDGSRYAMLLDALRVWCDGKKQWNYMQQTNEIYITSADSEEAQNFSPVYLMELYKKGYSCLLEENGGCSTITLTAENEETSPDRVVVRLNNATMRPERLELYIKGQGHCVIGILGYENGVELDDAFFRCPLNEYPDTEIIDMEE